MTGATSSARRDTLTLVSMDARLARGIELLNGREFFESHEALEAVWTTERGPKRLFFQALIHIAVGSYHWSRGNPEGARRQLRKALLKMESYTPECEGVNVERLSADTRQMLAQIETGEAKVEYPRIHLGGQSSITE
jgi:predicted metal-dependent hydrolase